MVEFDQRLRVFDFFCDKLLEDNVTRALLCVISRSLSGAAIVKNLVERLMTEIDLTARPELAVMWTAVLERVRTQVSFMGEDLRETGADFTLLVVIAPETEPPPSVTTGLQPQGRGRLDGALRFSAREKSFDIIIESKLYGPASHEQIDKYRQAIGQDRCAVVRLKWDDVIGAIDSLPESNRQEPLVQDFVDYLESLYWMLGFRGIAQRDFTAEGRDRRLRQLRLLAESLCGDGELFDRVDAVRVDRGDLNLRLRDESELLGNVGIASWTSDSVVAKLVIAYGGGPRRLLNADCQRISQVFEAMTRHAGGAELSIGFRIQPYYFKGEQEKYISSRPIVAKAGESWLNSWQKAREWLTIADSRADVTDESLDQMSSFADGEEIEKIEDVRRHLPQLQSRARPPKHYGALVVALPVDPAKLMNCGGDLSAAKAVVLEKLQPLVLLLRDLKQYT